MTPEEALAALPDARRFFAVVIDRSTGARHRKPFRELLVNELFLLFDPSSGVDEEVFPAGEFHPYGICMSPPALNHRCLGAAYWGCEAEWLTEAAAKQEMAHPRLLDLVTGHA